MEWLHIVIITLIYVHEPKTVTWAKECEIPDYAYSEKRRKNQNGDETIHLDHGLERSTGNPLYESKLTSINTRKKIDELSNNHVVFPRYHHTNSIVHAVLQVPSNQSTYHKLLQRYQPYGYGGAYTMDSSKNIFNIYLPKCNEELPKDLILPSMHRDKEETDSLNYNTRDADNVSKNVNSEINTIRSLIDSVQENNLKNKNSNHNRESFNIPPKNLYEAPDQPFDNRQLVSDLQTISNVKETKTSTIELAIPIEKHSDKVHRSQNNKIDHTLKTPDNEEKGITQIGHVKVTSFKNFRPVNESAAFEKLDPPYENMVNHIMNTYNSSDNIISDEKIIELNEKNKIMSHNIVSAKINSTTLGNNLNNGPSDQILHTIKEPVDLQLKKHGNERQRTMGKPAWKAQRPQKRIQPIKEQPLKEEDPSIISSAKRLIQPKNLAQSNGNPVKIVQDMVTPSQTQLTLNNKQEEKINSEVAKDTQLQSNSKSDNLMLDYPKNSVNYENNINNKTDDKNQGWAHSFFTNHFKGFSEKSKDEGVEATNQSRKLDHTEHSDIINKAEYAPGINYEHNEKALQPSERLTHGLSPYNQINKRMKRDGSENETDLTKESLNDTATDAATDTANDAATETATDAATETATDAATDTATDAATDTGKETLSDEKVENTQEASNSKEEIHLDTETESNKESESKPKLEGTIQHLDNETSQSEIKEANEKKEYFNNETMSEMTAELNSTEINRDELVKPMSSLMKFYKKLNFFRNRIKSESKGKRNHSIADITHNDNSQYFNNADFADENTIVSKGIRNYGAHSKTKYKQEFDSDFMQKWLQLQQAYMSHLEKHIPPKFPPIKSALKNESVIPQFPVELARNISQEFPMKVKESEEKIEEKFVTNDKRMNNSTINDVTIINEKTINDVMKNYATMNDSVANDIIVNDAVINSVTTNNLDDTITNNTMMNDTIDEMIQESLDDNSKAQAPEQQEQEGTNTGGLAQDSEELQQPFKIDAPDQATTIPLELTTESLDQQNKKRDIHCCFKLNEGQSYNEREDREHLKQIDLKIEDSKKKGSPLKETSIEMILTKDKMSQGPFKEKFSQHILQSDKSFNDEMQPFKVLVKNTTKNKLQVSNTQGMKEFNKLYNLAKVDKNQDKWEKQIKKLYEIISEEKKEMERNKTTYSSLHKALENKFDDKKEEAPTFSSGVDLDPWKNSKEQTDNSNPYKNKFNSQENPKLSLSSSEEHEQNKALKNKQAYEENLRNRQRYETKRFKMLLKNPKSHKLANEILKRSKIHNNSTTKFGSSKNNNKVRYQSCVNKFRDDLLKEELEVNNNLSSSYSNDKDVYIEGIKFNNDQLSTILQALENNKQGNESMTNGNIISSDPSNIDNYTLINKEQIKAKLLKKCENIKSNISYILNLMSDLHNEGKSNQEKNSQSIGFDNLLNNLRKFNRIQYFSTSNGKDFVKLNPGSVEAAYPQKQYISLLKDTYGKHLRGTSKEDSDTVKVLESVTSFDNLKISEATPLDRKSEDTLLWSNGEVDATTSKNIKDNDNENILLDTINIKLNEKSPASIQDEIHSDLETSTAEITLESKDSVKENSDGFIGKSLDKSTIKKLEELDRKRNDTINEQYPDTLNNKEVEYFPKNQSNMTETSTVKIGKVEETTEEKYYNQFSDKELYFPHESILDTISGKSIIKLVQKEAPDLLNSIGRFSQTTTKATEEDKDGKESIKLTTENVSKPYVVKIASSSSIKNATNIEKYKTGGKKRIPPNLSPVFNMAKLTKLANHIQGIPNKVSMPIIIDILNDLMYKGKDSDLQKDEDEENSSDKRLKRQDFGSFINIPASNDIEINMKVKKGKRKKLKKYKSSYNKLMRSKIKKVNMLLTSKKRNKEKSGESKRNRVKQIYMPNFRSHKGMRIVPPFLFGDNVITINVTPCESYYKSKKNMKNTKRPYSKQEESKNNETSMVTETKYFVMSNVKGEVTERAKTRHETQLRLPLRFFRFKLGTSATPTSSDGLRRKFSTTYPSVMTQGPVQFETVDHSDDREIIKSALQEFKGKTLMQLNVPMTTSMPLTKTKIDNKNFKMQLEKIKAMQELSLINKMSERAYDFLRKIPTQKTFTRFDVFEKRTYEPITQASENKTGRLGEHEFTFTVTLKPHNNQSIIKAVETIAKPSTPLPPITNNLSENQQEEKINDKFKILDLDYDMDYFSTESQPRVEQTIMEEMYKENLVTPPQLISIEPPPIESNFGKQILIPLDTTEKIPILSLATPNILMKTFSIPKYTEFNFGSQDLEELKLNELSKPQMDSNVIKEETDKIQVVTEVPQLTDSMDDIILDFEQQTDEVTEPELITEPELQPITEINQLEISEADLQNEDTTEIQYDDELETALEALEEKPKIASLYQTPITTESVKENLPESEHEDILNEFLEYEIPSQETKSMKPEELLQSNIPFKQELTQTQPPKETLNQESEELLQNNISFKQELTQTQPPKEKTNEQQDDRENESGFSTDKESTEKEIEKEVLATTKEENEFLTSLSPATTEILFEEETNKMFINNEQLFNQDEDEIQENNEDNNDETKDEDDIMKDEDLDGVESIGMMEMNDTNSLSRNQQQQETFSTPKNTLEGLEDEDNNLDPSYFQEQMFWKNASRKLQDPAGQDSSPHMSGDLEMSSALEKTKPNITESNVTVDIQSMKLELEQLKELLDKSPLADKMYSLKNLVESSNMNFTQNNTSENIIANSLEENETSNKEEPIKTMVATLDKTEGKENETSLMEKPIIEEASNDIYKFDEDRFENVNTDKNQDDNEQNQDDNEQNQDDNEQNQELLTNVSELSNSSQTNPLEQEVTEKSILRGLSELNLEIDNLPQNSLENSEDLNSPEESKMAEIDNPSNTTELESLETLQKIDRDDQDLNADVTNETSIFESKILEMGEPGDTLEDENSNLINVEVTNGTNVGDVQLQNNAIADNETANIELLDKPKDDAQWTEQNYTSLEEMVSTEPELIEINGTKEENDPNSIILLDNISNDPTRWVLHEDNLWQHKPWDTYKSLENSELENPIKNYFQKEKYLKASKMEMDDSKYLGGSNEQIMNFLKSGLSRDNFIHHSNKFGKIMKESLVKRNHSRIPYQHPNRKYIKSRYRSNKIPNRVPTPRFQISPQKDKVNINNKNMNTFPLEKNSLGAKINRKVVSHKEFHNVKPFNSKSVKKQNSRKIKLYTKSKSNKVQTLKTVKLQDKINSTLNSRTVHQKHNLSQAKIYFNRIHNPAINLQNKYVSKLKNQTRTNATEFPNAEKEVIHSTKNNKNASSTTSNLAGKQYYKRIKAKANLESGVWQKANNFDHLRSNLNRMEKLYDRNIIRKINQNYRNNIYNINPKLLSQGKSVTNNLRKSSQKNPNFYKQRLNRKMSMLKNLQNKDKEAKITPEEERKIKQILDGIVCRYKGHTNDTEEENFMRFRTNKLSSTSKKNMTRIKNHNKYVKMGQKLDRSRFKVRAKEKNHMNYFIDPRQQQRFFQNRQKKPFSLIRNFNAMTNYGSPGLSEQALKEETDSKESELHRDKKNYVLGTPIIRTIQNKNSPGFMSVINTQVKKVPNVTNSLGTNHNKASFQYKIDDGLEQMSINEMLKNHSGTPIHGILSLVYPEDVTNMTLVNDYLGGPTGYSGVMNDASCSGPGSNLINNQFNHKQFEELLVNLEKENVTDNMKYKEMVSLLKDNQKEAGRNRSRDDEDLKAKMKAIKWMVNFKNGPGSNKYTMIKPDSLMSKQEAGTIGQSESRDKEDEVESMKKFITKYKVLLKMFEEQHGKSDIKEDTNQKLVKNNREDLLKEGSMLVQRPTAMSSIWKKAKSKEKNLIKAEDTNRNIVVESNNKKKIQKMYMFGQNKQRKEAESPIEDLSDTEGPYIIRHLQDEDDYDNLENCSDIEFESYDETIDKRDNDTIANNTAQILGNGTGFIFKDGSHLQSLPSGLLNKYRTIDKYKSFHSMQGPRTKTYRENEPNLKLNSSTINKMFKGPINPFSCIGEINIDKYKTNWDNWTYDRTVPTTKLRQPIVTDDPLINLTQEHNIPLSQSIKDDDKEVMVHTNDNVLMLPIKFNTSDFMKLLNYKEVNDTESIYQDYEPSNSGHRAKLWEGDNRSSYIFDVDKGGPNGIKNRYYITFDSLSPNTVKVKNVSTIPVSNFSNFVNKGGNPSLNVVSIRKVISPWDKMNFTHTYINNKNVKGYLRPEIRSIEKVCLWLRKPLSYNLTHQVPKVAISLGEVWPPMAEGQGPRNMKHYLVQVDPLITPSKFPNQHIDYPSQISKVVWKAILHGFKTPKKAWQLTNQLG